MCWGEPWDGRSHYPEESIQHSEHGEKFEIKRTMLLIFCDNPVLAARDYILYRMKVEYERECVVRILKDVFKAYCKMQYQHPLENMKKMMVL